MTPERKLKEARRRFAQHTQRLVQMADWKESLEHRLATAQCLVDDALPDPHFDCLMAEVEEFKIACHRLRMRRDNNGA